jgi:hypothetical protein
MVSKYDIYSCSYIKTKALPLNYNKNGTIESYFQHESKKHTYVQSLKTKVIQ